MSNPHEIYEQLCFNLKVSTDNKVMRALIDVSKSGELNLSGLSLTAQTCEVLSKVLPQTRDVVKLNLGDCLLPPQGLAVLLSAMHLSHVSSLQLRGNNIAGPSVFKLSKMLSRSANIKTLGLEWNNLGLCSEAMAHFCNALGANHGLEALDLRNNQLDEGCAALLAAAIRKNITLRALDVRWNTIEQIGGQYFLSALQINKTLTTLRLQGNAISNDLLTAIEQCVQHNLNLLRLESGYEARKELLANHAKAVASQRLQELRDLADKSQHQLSEMDTKVKELEGSLVSRQQQLDEAQREVTERSRELEAAQSLADNLRQEMKLREGSHAATIRDYRLQIDILNKALTANKGNVSDLESQLEEEQRLREAVERERDRDKERIRKLELEVEKRKEELQTTITEHIAAVEQERSQSQQRLALAEQDWSLRLEQRSAENSRAEQVYRDKIRALESALEAGEQSRAELNTQWTAERVKWAEEKANILADAREKESCKIILLTEKVDHLKEEKISLENQLSVCNSTVQQLQRDNSSLMADLAEMRRKLTSVQEELSSERVMVQKLRSEQSEHERGLEAMKAELVSTQRQQSEVLARQDELRREVHRMNDKLEEKDRIIANIRKEEKDRAAILVTAIKTYVDQVNAVAL